MSGTYVPGYGYVDSSASRNPVRSPQRTPDGGIRVDTGQGSTRVVYPDANKQKRFDPVLPDTGSANGSTASGDRSSLQKAYGIDARDPIVALPNLNWYYSSADSYGMSDPSDPLNAQWNYGLIPTEAENAFDDDSLVPPELRSILDSIAKSIHPLKGGRSLWEEAVAASALASQRGEFVTPYAILRERYFKQGGVPQSDGAGSSGGGSSYGGGGGGYGGDGGGGQVSLTNPTSARGLLMQTMQSVLGRNPTGEEYKTFLQVLNEAEMANPQTASVEGDVVVGSGGVDPGVLALEFAQDQEDYRERQGDNYFRTFMQALAGGN